MDLNPVQFDVLNILSFMYVLATTYAGTPVVTSTFVKESTVGFIQCANKCLKEYSACLSIYYSKSKLECRMNYEEKTSIHFVPDEYQGFKFFTKEDLQKVLHPQESSSQNSCLLRKRRVVLSKTSTCVPFFPDASETVNIAVNKNTEQSTTAARGVSSRAVDGNMDPNYGRGSCTHTNIDTEHWWRVDLARLYSIDKIQIKNRGNRCGDRLRNFKLYVGFEISDMDIVGFYVGAATDAELITFNFQYPVRGRHVQIMMGGETELNLCEVKVYGVEIHPQQ